MSFITGYKTVMDKARGIEILPEGTHGTSGWMNKKEIGEVLETGGLDTLDKTLFGKLENGNYVAMKDMLGMSRNVIIYGAPGTGKSRGFVMPFAMQAARRGESIIMIDPKAEFFEMYSEFLNSEAAWLQNLISDLTPRSLSQAELFAVGNLSTRRVKARSLIQTEMCSGYTENKFGSSTVTEFGNSEYFCVEV